MSNLSEKEKYCSSLGQDPEKTCQLVFGGCGGMYNYSIGVAATIQEHFSPGRETIVSGSSAGCFPALLLALDMNIEDMFETWNIPFLQDVNKRRFGALAHWNNIVRNWTMPSLSEDAHIHASGHLYCSLTSVPDFKNHIVSDWRSNQDLLDGIMASAFVPIFDTFKLTAKFRGRRFIDGSLTNSCPLPLGGKIPSCIIRRDMWRPNETSWLWCWSDTDWARRLFAWGKEDAEDHLEELGAALKPSRVIELL